ncbi:MAG: MFS transporter [Candidatus Latescibacteria bacterium]|jgi:MFS family permease|nr:MFS transporter [Candidatus Latescibacterota bacterium]MBT4138071.1 MFS transporter [Candidatus Latescibacterota bacterium]
MSTQTETEAVEENPPRWARPVFLFITSLYWLTLYFYVPILSPYVEHMGGTLEMVGLVVSAYGLAQLILRFPLGLWSDRLGKRRPFLALGFAANILGCLVFVVATDPWVMVGARFLSGIAACAWVAFSVLFASYFPAQKTSQAMSYITFCNTLSIMVATFIGGWIADVYGWLAPFWLSAGVGVLGLIGTLFIYEKTVPAQSTQPITTRLRSILSYRELIFASLVAAFGQYTTFATHFGFLPNYAVEIGASKTQLGILAMLGMLSISITVLLSGTVFAPRIGAKRTLVIAYLLVGIATAALPYIQTIELLYVSQVIAGLGRGAGYPILMSLAIARLPDAEKATAMGFFQGVYAIGMFIGPVSAGTIGGQWGYEALFLSTAGVAVLTAVVALRLPGKA